MESSSSSAHRAGNVKVRSVSVQTEGKLAPYPDGSLWMEAPGARSLLFQQQSAALASAAAAVDCDNSSVGFHSVQSLWRSVDHANAAAAAGGSLASSEDNYSVKTASHVLQAPARSKTKPSQVIAKMRRQNMRNVNANTNSGGDLQRNSYMSIEGETMYAGSGGGGGPGNSSGAFSRGPRTPLSVHLSSPNPGAPSPLSLGSNSLLLRPSSLLMSSALLNNHNPTGQNHGYPTAPAKTSGFSPSISIAGQGFVAPLVLPKL